jgi:tetratricopeptide (TPR) repeat protein
MRRTILMAAMIATAISIALAAPSTVHAQSRSQLGPLCTSETTPAEKQIDACNKIIALKASSGAQLSKIYFWRAVAFNKLGDYAQVIADSTEALRLQPDEIALYNLRGSAYYDKGEYDIAIADYNDALRIGPPNASIFHNRGNAYRGKRDYVQAVSDYDQAIRLVPTKAFSFQNRGTAKRALGDLDGALADINEAIRLRPSLASTYINRAVIWRAKGDIDRAIADGTEAIRLVTAAPPTNILTPPNSVLIHATVERGLAYEAKGDVASAKADYTATLATTASDAGSKSNQATAKVRLSLLSGGNGPPAAPPAPSPAGVRRVALVIGNGSYAHVTALPNPPNDARAIAKSLRELGFEVAEGIDLDRATMQNLARDFLRDAAQAQTALLYYAGHGVQIDGRNYLVPVDVELHGRNPVDAMTDMDTILAGLEDQVRTNILIFDACRNNPIAQQTASAGHSRAIASASGLAAPATPSTGATRGAGTLIAFATAPGQVALDGDGSNSPFSAALSHHIGTPGLEVQQMLTRVRAEVVTATGNRQVPWSNSSLLGEVFLATK